MKGQDQKANHTTYCMAYLDRNWTEPVKRIHTDSEKELAYLRKECKAKEVVLNTTLAHMPKSDGLAKQMNRTVMINQRKYCKSPD